ncbi:hypothetical protein R1flu_016544 [Riccia fluitans]|uniref:Uncharacterized protein n=1 Tax=Riccia fluitans TaxID=41844 RepID=A0ABD1YMC4_9MARC
MANTAVVTASEVKALLNNTKDLSSGSSEKAEAAKEEEMQEGEESQESDWRAADWEWPCYDELYNKQGEVIERRRNQKEEEKMDPFEVIYCHIKDYLGRNVYWSKSNQNIFEPSCKKYGPTIKSCG